MDFKFKDKVYYGDEPVTFLGQRFDTDDTESIAGHGQRVLVVRSNLYEGWEFDPSDHEGRCKMCSNLRNKIVCFGITERLFWLNERYLTGGNDYV